MQPGNRCGGWEGGRGAERKVGRGEVGSRGSLGEGQITSTSDGSKWTVRSGRTNVLVKW